MGFGILLLLAIASPALAQQDEPAATGTSDAATEETVAAEAVDVAVQEAAAEEAVNTVIEEVGLSPEALEDETVTETDLDAETPGAFQFLKTFKRTVRRTITRDPIKKAEYRIEEAHEQLLKARHIAEENPNDPKAQAKVEKALDKFEANIEKIKEHAADIKEKKSEQADKFLEKIADFQFKQQKMLDTLEEKLPEQAFAKIKEARERSMEHQAQVMSQVAENQQQIADSFTAAFENQQGSEFRDFKNMEVLSRMEQFIPEESRDMIGKVKDETRLRFEATMQNLPDAEAGIAFNRYVENITGDPANQLRTLNEIKSQGEFSDVFFENIEKAKEKTINKFEERFRRFEDPVSREAFLDELGDGSTENLRVIQQIQNNVPEEIKQEIAKKEEESIQRFKEKFIDNPDAQARAEQFQELAKKMRENPDPSTFAAIQKLKEGLPPEQKAFADSLKEEAEHGFEQEFAKDQNMFLKRIESFDPNTIQQLQQLSTGGSEALQGIVNQALSQQIDFTHQQLQNFDDPARFERFKQQIDQNENLKQRIEVRYSDFDSILQSKQGEIQQIKQKIEQEFETRINKEREIRAEQGLPDFNASELTNIKERFLLRPQLGVDEQTQEQFRNIQEVQMQQQFQNQVRTQAAEQGLQGNDLKKFLEEQGINKKAQKEFEQPQQGSQNQILPNFQNITPELRQKLEQQFQNNSQGLKQQIQQENVPQAVQERIQRQNSPLPQQAIQRGTPSPIGTEQRFDPRTIAPGDRGDIRSDEVREPAPTNSGPGSLNPPQTNNSGPSDGGIKTPPPPQ